MSENNFVERNDHPFNTQTSSSSPCCSCVLGDNLRESVMQYIEREASDPTDVLNRLRSSFDFDYGGHQPCCTLALIIFLCYICKDVDGFIDSLRPVIIADK